MKKRSGNKGTTEMILLRKEHQRWCRVKYTLILLAYTADWLFKLYVGYEIGGLSLAIALTSLDFVAKAYHLSVTKIRKPDEYQQIVRSR